MTPHLDALAAEGVTGLCEPVGPGITPGSGPGHLGIFGYDPQAFELGRGALSAAGLDFALQAGDVAARGNFCTLDADGLVTDRRAGRIPDPDARAVVDKLQAGVHLDGAEVFFRHEREHRLLVVLRGPGLDPRVADTDPQATGVPPLEAEPLDPEAKRTAELVDRAGRPGARRARRRAAGQLRPAPRVRHAPRPAVVRRPLRAARRGRRHLPDVPGDREPARHGRARPAAEPRRAARDHAAIPGPTTTTSSCTTSTPTRPARTATGPARSRRSRRSTRSSPRCGRSDPTSSQ